MINFKYFVTNIVKAYQSIEYSIIFLDTLV